MAARGPDGHPGPESEQRIPEPVKLPDAKPVAVADTHSFTDAVAVAEPVFLAIGRHR